MPPWASRGIVVLEDLLAVGRVDHHPVSEVLLSLAEAGLEDECLHMRLGCQGLHMTHQRLEVRVLT
jgi:hypothetical protein